MLSERRARELALQALAFIASDPEMTAAMLAGSGLQPDEIRHAASQPEFGIFLLDFILQDDDRVLAFAADQQIKPESVLYARDLLAHLDIAAEPDDDGWG